MRLILLATMGALVIGLAGCGPAQQGSAPANAVTVKGSDTMVHLVTAWAENFMKAHPGAEVSVTGGGSGTGIAALLNKTTDLCAASRDMSAAEKDQASQKGVQAREFVVARDGIAVVVNPANPVNELTMEQLKKIFTGALTDWAQVGGPPGAFIVLSRESSSGTYIFFQEHVLEKEDYAARVRLMPATSAIIQATADDANAIGYVGLGYAAEAGAKIKVLRIKADDAASAIEPSEESVRNGTYSIARPLYLYAGDPVGKTASDFIQYSLSDAGQQIVRENGYVTVK